MFVQHKVNQGILQTFCGVMLSPEWGVLRFWISTVGVPLKYLEPLTSNTMSHPRRPDSELLYCANLKSHTRFIFSFYSSTSVPVTGQRNSIKGCWNCLTVSFDSQCHIFIWDLVELYLTILNVQRTFISYLLAPLTIISMLFNSLAVWLLLLFISRGRTRKFPFVLFSSQMSYVLLWNERWSTFVFCQFTSVSKLLYFKALELSCHCIVQILRWKCLQTDLPF